MLFPCDAFQEAKSGTFHSSCIIKIHSTFIVCICRGFAFEHFRQATFFLFLRSSLDSKKKSFFCEEMNAMHEMLCYISSLNAFLVSIYHINFVYRTNVLRHRWIWQKGDCGVRSERDVFAEKFNTNANVNVCERTRTVVYSIAEQA